MFPNLPTDNLYKFICIGGIALMVVGSILYYDFTNERNQLFDSQLENGYNYDAKINEAYFLDSIDLRKHVSELRSDSLRFVSQYKIVKGKIAVYNNLLNIATAYFIIGNILFMWGVWRWEKLQNKQNFLSDLEYKVNSRKYTECQSCGTELQYKEINEGLIYCTHCHNGYSFTNPDLYYSDMESQIKSKMKSDGFTDKEIQNHLKKLPSLYRWKPTLKW